MSMEYKFQRLFIEVRFKLIIIIDKLYVLIIFLFFVPMFPYLVKVSAFFIALWFSLDKRELQFYFVIGQNLQLIFNSEMNL